MKASGFDIERIGFEPFDYEEIADAVTVPDKCGHCRARHNVAPPVMRCNGRQGQKSFHQDNKICDSSSCSKYAASYG